MHSAANKSEHRTQSVAAADFSYLMDPDSPPMALAPSLPTQTLESKVFQRLRTAKLQICTQPKCLCFWIDVAEGHRALDLGCKDVGRDPGRASWCIQTAANSHQVNHGVNPVISCNCNHSIQAASEHHHILWSSLHKSCHLSSVCAKTCCAAQAPSPSGSQDASLLGQGLAARG